MNPQSQPIDPASLPRPIDPSANTSQNQLPVTSLPNSQSQTDTAQHVGQTSKKSAHSPEIAEDVDLIEKEWVEKAKHIVATTKDNPREQNVEIAKLKADYMKKRYNKDLEVDTE